RLAEELRLGRLLVRFFGADPESWGGEAEREAARAIEIFEAAGDDAALAKAWRLLASVHGRSCRFEDEAKAGRRAMEHARRAGDRAGAERELRRDYDALDAMGEKYLLSTIAGLLAEALCAQGRYDEANAMCMITAAAASEDDAQSQALWRSVRGKVLARRNDRAHALELAREAVEILRR